MNRNKCLKIIKPNSTLVKSNTILTKASPWANILPLPWSKLKWESVTKKGSTSQVWIEMTYNYVLKKTNLYLNYTVFEREVYWLKKLQNFDWCPRFIWAQKPYLITSFVGERLNKENCPPDWESQVEQIEQDLKRVNCRHNDIKDEEVLIKEGKIYLIDFQWASLGEDYSASQPKLSKTKRPGRPFNDLKIIFHHVLNGSLEQYQKSLFG